MSSPIYTINTGLSNNRNVATIYTNPIEISQEETFQDFCVDTGNFSYLCNRFNACDDCCDGSSNNANANFANEFTQSGNADTVITITGKEDDYWAIDWIAWSYTAAPTTSPELIVNIGGEDVFKHTIATAGWDGANFEPPLYIQDKGTNEDVVITLEAGGAGITGNLQVTYR